MQRAKRQRELGCGYTLYGWDGDNLAWESSPPQDEGETGRTVHYLYEPDSFVPVAQALRKAPIRLLRQPDWRGREYDIDQDPLWQHEVKPQPIDAIAWYQCDHLGTPMELTDHHAEVAWAGQYKAWGDVREERSEWAKQVGMSNPIRFQGQYHDHETGLHYNRYRYYDPRVGRFVSQDPISYTGGLNLFAYAPNPVQWTDALGLERSLCDCMKKGDPDGKGNFRGGSYGGTTTRGVESHHMPADSVSPIKRSQGPAIQMDPSDHARTSSHGRQGNAGKAYRAEIQQMINSENMRGTMAMEIRDVRRVASESGQPRKYNVAMQEMLAYSKCQGYLVKK